MSISKSPQQIVQDQIRDKVFAQIRYQNDNNVCIDCQRKNPKWTSVYLGIHLCIDCAGKHRQYGVVNSFIKSTNLDAWNQKQLLYMQKGSNSRAIEHFRKCGIINNANKHIDYKSQAAQKLKAILTEEVEAELAGKPILKKEKKEQQNIQMNSQVQEIKDIPNGVVEVEQKVKKPKKKAKKTKGTEVHIDLQDYEVNDGITVQKQKVAVECTKPQVQKPEEKVEQIAKPLKIQQVKQLSEQQKLKKIQEMKVQQKKSISSEDFKNNDIDNIALKQNLNKFQGSKSISKADFFNETEESQSNVKEMMINAGGNLYSKITAMWKK